MSDKVKFKRSEVFKFYRHTFKTMTYTFKNFQLTYKDNL